MGHPAVSPEGGPRHRAPKQDWHQSRGAPCHRTSARRDHRPAVAPARPATRGRWRPRTAGDKLAGRVLSVVATKIRTSRDQSGLTSTVGRIYEGYLLSEPVVGRGMVIFRDPNGRRMVTTAVRRVLATSESNVLYVETENSVYRISIREEHIAAATA